MERLVCQALKDERVRLDRIYEAYHVDGACIWLLDIQRKESIRAIRAIVCRALSEYLPDDFSGVDINRQYLTFKHTSGTVHMYDRARRTWTSHSTLLWKLRQPMEFFAHISDVEKDMTDGCRICYMHHNAYDRVFTSALPSPKGPEVRFGLDVEWMHGHDPNAYTAAVGMCMMINGVMAELFNINIEPTDSDIPIHTTWTEEEEKRLGYLAPFTDRATYNEFWGRPEQATALAKLQIDVHKPDEAWRKVSAILYTWHARIPPGAKVFFVSDNPVRDFNTFTKYLGIYASWKYPVYYVNNKRCKYYNPYDACRHYENLKIWAKNNAGIKAPHDHTPANDAANVVWASHFIDQFVETSRAKRKE